MNTMGLALAMGVLAGAPALASDKSDIMAVLQQWNDNDEAKAVAACADDASVVDDIPPFEWHGPSACSRWQKDFDAYVQSEGLTDVTGTIGNPGHLIISGDRAYAVVPTTFAFTQQGKPVKHNATTTFALHKTAGGWRITAWTWTNH
jgi:ketosteroid isomerase-like protein